MLRDRWAWAEIDLTAIHRNIAQLKRLLKPECKFMAVVKADAYGHGAFEVAREALSAGATHLGVATVEEAIELRRAGLTTEPILVLSQPPEDSIIKLLEYDITPTVYTPEFALALGGAANARDTQAPIHVKIDTGMNRIGVPVEDAPGFLASFSFHKGLKLEGVFTHFATADIPGDWEFTTQLEKFKEVIDEIRTQGIDPGIVHAANSAATILSPQSHFDMVRCGIAIYGLHPGEATKERIQLDPAMSIKGRLAHAHKVGLGEGVSYGFAYRTSVDAQLGVVPMGYADGVQRVLSNKMEVLCGGHRVRQVGTICMDQFMIELSGAERRSNDSRELKVGDEVIVVGTQGDKEISLDELAARAGTINYELACDLGLRLHRHYI